MNSFNNITPETQWLIGIVISTVGIIFASALSVFGWIYVHRSNLKNIKHEKELSIKLHGYESLSTIIKECIIKYSEYSSTISSTMTNLKIYHADKDNMFLKDYRDKLINQYKEHQIFNLHEQASNCFVRFIFAWEQYELVFKELVKQRFALQEEHSRLNEKFDEVYQIYTQLMLDMEYKKEIEPEELLTQLMTFYELMLDFSFCVTDLSHNLQNYVFGDFLKDKLGKRKVADVNIPTIYVLMERYKEKIEKDYF